jgi:predicted GH43/DUF377 family glycosyl hydrolase
MPYLQKPLKKRMRSILQTDWISFKKKIAKGLILATLICFIGTIGWLYHRMRKLESKQATIRRTIKMLGYGPLSSSECLGKTPIPLKLSGIPLAEDAKIVLEVKELNIRNVTAPYNPSLIESSSGYDLFFRYDVVNPKLEYANFSSRIGVVPLNHRFEQENQEFKRIDLQTDYAEDPRVLMIGDQLYLFCNQLNENYPKCRCMCAVNIDPKTYAVNYSTTLDMNLHWVEKNWSPFEYIGKNQEPHLFLEYRINPRKLLELPDPQINELKNITTSAEAAYLSIPWPEKWGEIRGGTPAKKIGDEYLGFFHSYFTDERQLFWYVMGAYTFSATPPFNLTGMSKYPILFRGIYETPFTNTASVNKRVIFPCGFVLETQNDRELIHLACGENDSNIKIVTMDKEQLLKSILRFETIQ